MASDYARRRRSTYRAWPHCPTDPEATPNSATPQQPRSPPPTPGRCARRTTPPGLPARARAHRHTRQTQPIPHRPRRQRHVVRAGRTAPPTGGRSLHHLAQAHLPALTRGSAAAPSSAPTSFGGGPGRAARLVNQRARPSTAPRRDRTDTHQPNSQRCHPSRPTANGCNSPDDPLPTLAAAPPANVSRRRDGCQPDSPPTSASWVPATAQAAYERLPPPGHSQARPGRRQPAVTRGR